MNLLNKCLAVGVIAALPTTAIAATAPDKCITHEELKSVAASLMPSVLESVMVKCAVSLDKSTYLVAKGPELLTRYQAHAKGNEGALAATLARLKPLPELENISPEKLGPVLGVFISAALQKAIKPQSCGDISQALSYFDPLPPENLIGFVDFAVTKIQASEAKKRKRDTERAKKKDSFDFLCSSTPADSVTGK